MPRQCESVSPSRGMRCILNAGHSGAHTTNHGSDTYTWLDPIGTHAVALRSHRLVEAEADLASMRAVAWEAQHGCRVCDGACASSVEIDGATVEALLDRAEHAQAKLVAAMRALDRVLRVVTKIGGYMAHEDQVELWRARALLAEGGSR